MFSRAKFSFLALRSLSGSKIILCFLIFAFFTGCNFFKEKSSENTFQYAGLRDSAHYVGMNTCRQCHTTIYDSYIKTGMGQSFDLAGHSKSSAIFSEHAVVRDSFKNLFYHPYWSVDSLMIDEFRLLGKDTIHKRTERIEYIVGSGQHTNSHMWSVNGYVYQIPATFFTQKGTWDLPPGFEGGHNSRFSRKIELECMSCHNAYPEIVPGSENKYKAIPGGIDCERCHGPGSIHVALKQQRELIDTSKYIDYSIVNPAKLPIALQLDICQRCHIQGNAVLNDNKSFYDFRPGMKLSDVMNVFMPVYKGDDDAHIMASHAERLKMSKCFQLSLEMAEKNQTAGGNLRPYKNALTCVTCHNPHVSVKSTSADHFNQVCKNCHTSSSSAGNASGTVHEKECSESPELRKTALDNCVSCHMPKNGTIDIPHVTNTDHYIRRKITEKKINQIREFVRLACINNSNVDRRTLGKAYLNYFEKFVPDPAFLDSAKKYLDDSGKDSIRSNFHQLVRWAFLKSDYAKVLNYVSRLDQPYEFLNRKSYVNEDAWTAYRIGESFSYSNQKNQAEKFLTLAIELEPFNLEFRNKLGSIQQEIGKISDAIKTYQFILEENPKFVSAWINFGYLMLTVKNDVKSADEMYANALALDPDNEQALLNMAGTKYFLGKNGEAGKLLDRLLKINPANETAKILKSKLEAGR